MLTECGFAGVAKWRALARGLCLFPPSGGSYHGAPRRGVGGAECGCGAEVRLARLLCGRCGQRCVYFLFPCQLTPSNNVFIRVLIRASCFLPFAGWLTPFCDSASSAASLPSFTTAMRVINRIHCVAANCRPFPHPAMSACLTHNTQMMFFVAHRANRRETGDGYPFHLL